MGKHLDVSKSVIISSPAGSGKTEKLSRRYISLLLAGSEIEKILCITFTEKAAAEMKERILNILEREQPDLFRAIQEKMPLMRISTIHSFCLKLLKRFSIELGLDPALEVTDEFNSLLLWSEAVYECLMDERDNPSLFFEMMKNRGIKGWDKVLSLLNTLYEQRPASEYLIKSKQAVQGEEEKILMLFTKCLNRYSDKKRELHLCDYNDLEILAYEALMKHPEWQNILYAFDEHTDHILVDEFQDTSPLQWKIIDKLTEEWRSGIGSKRSAGKAPTVFLVGDDKQSIYLFRGANASVFEESKQRLSEWLKQDYCFEEAKENFRSLPEIIDFTNALFGRIMSPQQKALPDMSEAWRTRYAPFEAFRKGSGRVELILLNSEENTKKNRIKEAAALAKRIRSLAGNFEIYEGEIKRKCTYADMAILLRQRTHLNVFENALRNEQIPFIAVKGIGFYDEPEAAILRELIAFVVDPLDDYSLFCLLRSPLFDISYDSLLNLITQKDSESGKKTPLFEKIQSSSEFSAISPVLLHWIDRAAAAPLSVFLEEALTETGSWKHYWEKQRLANIKKFIKLVETSESSGMSRLDIREKLIRARDEVEPKANINTEEMNAVKIMTVHAAKGLQFPMVFLPSLDESVSPKSSAIVIHEDAGKICFAYEEDSNKRRTIAPFITKKEKEAEEEKRLFYVAVTRAKDFLCMAGTYDPDKQDKQPGGRLGYIAGCFDIFGSMSSAMPQFLHVIDETEMQRISSLIKPSSVQNESQISLRHMRKTAQGPVYTEPISAEPALKWSNVTEDIDIRSTHGDEWVLLGRIFHSLFEELSKDLLAIENVRDRALFFLRNEFLSEKDINAMSAVIARDFELLNSSGHLKDIIMPRDNAHSELPFVLQKGSTVFRGRIDRVIIRDTTAFIYDYKTYPVKDTDIPLLTAKYKFQMEMYQEAVSKIFSLRTKGFLLFTHEAKLVEL